MLYRVVTHFKADKAGGWRLESMYMFKFELIEHAMQVDFSSYVLH